MKLHADCALLKRILEKRLKQHQEELNKIEEVKKSIARSDRLLLQTYANRLKDMRSEVDFDISCYLQDLTRINEYLDKQKKFLEEMFPNLYTFSV